MNQSVESSDGRLDIMEERRLIMAAQKGCAVSAHRLIAAHQDRLHAFVWRILRDEHDTDEVCQDAFLRAFSALNSFDFNYRFSTWLFTIGYRLCLNQMRRRRDGAGTVDFATISSTRPNDDHAGTNIGDAVANSDEARRLKDAIWDAVEDLAPPQRAAVMLFYREQLSCQQIGKILGMPAATVKSHLHRARAKLRESLSGRLAENWSDVRFVADAG
jgi:RNA polymerase sigma-70 factor (ECF subfamily)